MPGAHARRPAPTTTATRRTARAAQAVIGALVLTLVALTAAVVVVAQRPGPRAAEQEVADTTAARVTRVTAVGEAVVGVGAATPNTIDARSVLRDWDTRRARAWARADSGALRALYLQGSAAGTHDVAMLARWRDRDLRLTGLRTQVLALRVVSAQRRSLVLRVTDRVASAVAVGHGTRVRLPRDTAQTRRVSLSWLRGSWRVGEVRLVA